MNRSISLQTDSRRTSVTTITKLFVRTNEKQPPVEFDLEAFLNSLKFNELVQLDDENLTAELEEIDALHLFNLLQALTRELGAVKVENHFITDFLEKNDPKLLVGIKQRRLTSSYNLQSRPTSTPGTARVSSRPSIVTTQSAVTTISQFQTGSKRATDWRLNFRAKTEMAEKTAADVEKRIADMESKAMYKIKMLNTRIEEMRYSTAETQETMKNFELHFLKDERDLNFLENATEHQLEHKFRKFVHNWLKNGHSLLGTMRLRITSLMESCGQLRNDLMSKADLSGILSAVDFEKLIVKRNQQLVALEEKTHHLHGLKKVAGKASLSMSDEKKAVANIEKETKRITTKIQDVLKAISILEREADSVELENIKDMNTLARLQEDVDRYESPAINDYMERKAELSAFEKEIKMLQRKTYILQMKFNNALKRHKQRNHTNEIVSLQ